MNLRHEKGIGADSTDFSPESVRRDRSLRGFSRESLQSAYRNGAGVIAGQLGMLGVRFRELLCEVDRGGVHGSGPNMFAPKWATKSWSWANNRGSGP